MRGWRNGRIVGRSMRESKGLMEAIWLLVKDSREFNKSASY